MRRGELPSDVVKESTHDDRLGGAGKLRLACALQAVGQVGVAVRLEGPIGVPRMQLRDDGLAVLLQLHHAVGDMVGRRGARSTAEVAVGPL